MVPKRLTVILQDIILHDCLLQNSLHPFIQLYTKCIRSDCQGVLEMLRYKNDFVGAKSFYERLDADVSRLEGLASLFKEAANSR